MKLHAILAACLFIAFISHSCTDDDDNVNHVANNNYSAAAEFSAAFSPANLTALSLNAVSGEVSIQGVPASELDSIIVRGERRVESDSEADAQDHLPLLQVEMTVSEQVLAVRTDQPEQTEGRNYIVDYHIEIPEDLLVTASNVNGEVWIVQMTDTVTASVVNGNLHLSRAGTATASVVNGFLSFESYSGIVQGSVVNGGIHAEVAPPASGSCGLSITNGNIDLEIPDTTSAQLSASVVNGLIEVRDLTVGSPVVTQRSFTGILGAGDGAITLNAVNGNLLVRPFGI